MKKTFKENHPWLSGRSSQSSDRGDSAKLLESLADVNEIERLSLSVSEQLSLHHLRRELGRSFDSVVPLPGARV